MRVIALTEREVDAVNDLLELRLRDLKGLMHPDIPTLTNIQKKLEKNYLLV